MGRLAPQRHATPGQNRPLSVRANYRTARSWHYPFFPGNGPVVARHCHHRRGVRCGMAAAGNRCGLVVCNGRGFRHRSADHATGRHAARGAAWRTAAYGRPNRRYAVYPRAVATHYGAYRLLPILSAPARRACFIGLRPFHVPYPRTCRSSHGICPFPNNTGYHPRQLPEGGRISGKPWKVGLRIGKDTTLHRHLLPDRGRRTNYLSGIPQPDRHDGQQLRQTDAQPGHERQVSSPPVH